MRAKRAYGNTATIPGFQGGGTVTPPPYYLSAPGMPYAPGTGGGGAVYPRDPAPPGTEYYPTAIDPDTGEVLAYGIRNIPRGAGGGGGVSSSYNVSEYGPGLLAIHQQENDIAMLQAQALQEHYQALDAQARGDAIETARHNQAAEALQRQANDINQQYRADQAALGWGGMGVQMRGQDITALGDAASRYGELAQQELARQQYLGGLVANPRDWFTLMTAEGQGANFLDQLRRGQPMTGQGIPTGETLGQPAQRMYRNLSEQLTGHPVLDQALKAAQALSDRAGQPLSPWAGLDPVQQAAAAQFHQAGPTVPYDIVANIAQHPEAARQYLGAVPQYAGGGDMQLNEPAVLQGMITGQPLATMGEEAPAKPELLRPTPMGVKVIPTGNRKVLASETTRDASPPLKKIAIAGRPPGTYSGHDHQHDVPTDHDHEHAHLHMHGDQRHSHVHEHEDHLHGTEGAQ